MAAHIWGSDEKCGDNYILPQYIMGYYLKEDDNSRTFIENNMEGKQYRYLHQDATVDSKGLRSIDTENVRDDN